MELEGLESAFARAVSVWPDLGSNLEIFAAYLSGLDDGAPPAGWEAHAADLYLCCACLRGGQRAQRVFETQLLPGLVKVIARVKADDDFVQEALQLLRTKLLVGPEPGLRGYSGRGALQAWLRVTATRLAIDLTRARNVLAMPKADGLERVAALDIDPSLGVLKGRYAGAFQAALEQALHELPKRDRNVLRLRLVAGCSIDQLGRIYQKDRATTARWLCSARERVLTSVRRTLRVQHGLTRTEFDSLARVVLSHLELRVSALDSVAGEDGPIAPAELARRVDTADLT